MSSDRKDESPWIDKAVSADPEIASGPSLLLAIVVGVLATGVLLAAPIILSMLPSVPGFADGGDVQTGTLSRGVVLSVALLSISGGLVVGGFVYDPSFGNTVEIVVTAVGFFLVSSVSWVNIILGDTLLSWKTQIALDAIQIVFAVGILLLLARWRPSVGLLVGVRFIAIYSISAFALILPLIYATTALLIVFGMESIIEPKIDDWIKILSGVLALPTTALTVLGYDKLIRKQ